MVVGKEISIPAKPPKRNLLVETDLSRKPGHGSVPHDDNCIVKMAKAIERISSYRSHYAGPGPRRISLKGLRKSRLSRVPSC